MKHLTQSQLEHILLWLEVSTACRWESCAESQHMYFNDHYIGGWAGDERKFFLKDTKVTNHLLDMYRECS